MSRRLPRHAYPALNIYSASRPNGPEPSRRTVILVGCCLAIAIFGTTRLFYPPNRNGSHVLSRSRRKHRCWLKQALKSGEFRLFSHRSYHNNTQAEQPMCKESLVQLKNIGVSSLDLDLVLDERHDPPRLVVAHPMEYKWQSDYYSPCAHRDFDVMLAALKSVYGNDFFISMEPKAAWGNSQKEVDDVALTNAPSKILEVLLKKVKDYGLSKKNCAAIVEIKEGRDEQELEKEKQLLSEILQHCQLFKGIRLADDAPASMGEYDIIMPTIEFHPSHSHNVEGKKIPLGLLGKSLFWVVDNEHDLDLAADLRPFGVVSNSPKDIVGIVESSSWCNVSDGVKSALHSEPILEI